MRYSAFISYNHRDKAWAMWLHRALERYHVAKQLHGRPAPFGTIGARLPPVFRDRDELASSADLGEAVREALAESAMLIVICSPNSARSRWVNEEIRTFIAMGRRSLIRLIIVDGSPDVVGSDQYCIPPAIMEGASAEPLAADARRGQDGRHAAKLKILAAVLGVPYDDLRRREARRRQHRLIALTTASTIGFVVMAGLAATAWLARNEAVAQRRTAEQRTLTAERTLGFVKAMFRVSDPSEARGAAITAREVVDRGAKMLETGLEKEPAARADLGITLAEVYGALGLYRKSDQLVRHSLAIRHGQTVIRVRQLVALGESQMRLGDYKRSTASFLRAQEILKAVEGATPALRSRALVGLGQAQSAIDDFPAAQRSIAAALAIDRERGTEGENDLARDLEALGLNHFYAGDMKAAEPIIGRALSLRLALEGEASPSVADDRNSLAAIAHSRGARRKAEDLYRQNLAADERVLGPMHPDLAITLNNLARMLVEQRKFRQAEPLLERAIAINLRQRGMNHDDMVYPLFNLGLTRWYLGKQDKALQAMTEALRVARRHDHPGVGPILADIAEMRCRSGQTQSGMALLPEAVQKMRADYPDDPWREAWTKNVGGACLMKGGDRRKGTNELRESFATIAEKWPAGTLYGDIVRQRRF